MELIANAVQTVELIRMSYLQTLLYAEMPLWFIETAVVL